MPTKSANITVLTGGTRLNTVVAVVVLALVALGFALRRSRTGYANDDVAIELCRAAYRRALTAQDSAIVDAQRPITSRAQASVALTCRALRQSGGLR